jgi:hypothetical protein
MPPDALPVLKERSVDHLQYEALLTGDQSRVAASPSAAIDRFQKDGLGGRRVLLRPPSYILDE